MKITNGNNPYAYHQKQQANTKSSDFATIFADRAAGKTRDATAKTQKDDSSFQRMENPHKYHGAEINPSMGQLVLAKEPCTAELVVSEPFVAEPTYPASINDLSHDELKAAIYYAEQACRELNKEGMSKGEIYNQMEAIFQNFLGKDFREPNLLYAGVKNAEDGTHESYLQLAFQHFQIQLARADASASPETLREARGYTGMSDSEMRAAVREKYPENMTLKDSILMGTEMWELGLDEVNYGKVAKHHVFNTTGINSYQFTPKVQELYDALLNMPADLDAVKTAYANHAKNDLITYPTNNMDGVFERLLSWFGGNELANSELLSKVRAILDDMEKSGELVFDQFGYCRSPEKK